jgi:hypothetical protein
MSECALTPYDEALMPRDIVDFTPDREESYASVETIQAEIVQTLPYSNPYSKQLQPRRDGSLRWIALAVVVGGIVAIAFVNFFGH